MKNACRLSLLFLPILCLSALAGAQTAAPAGTDVALNATWTDPATALMWAGMDNGSDVNWNQATAYCSNLQLAGYKGWRLPTLEELRGIDDSSVTAKTTFDFGDSWVHVKGNLKLTGWHWSNSQGHAPGSNGPWNFNFQDEKAGDAFPIGFSYSMRALCVRRSGS